MLQADKLRIDPRIKEAKDLLLATAIEHSHSLSALRPAEGKLKECYYQTLERLTTLRGVGKLLLPYLGSGLGNGPLVELLDGSVKYDFIGGIGVHFFGHSHPALISSAIDAALSDLPIQGHLMQNREALELIDLLVEVVKIPHCFLTTSGAMAMENALKLAWQKRFPATRILAFDNCFSGRTHALSQITDKPKFREGIPPSIGVDYIPFYDEKRPEESCAEAITALKGAIARYPKAHAAMIFELVQGEGGIYAGSREFFSALMSLLKENEIAIIVDEIQTFGRTPELLAFHHFELEEYIDICTIGKLSLVCATLFRSEFAPRPGLLSQTFTSSTAAHSLSKVIVEMMIGGNYFGAEGKIVKQHQRFVAGLQSIGSKEPNLITGPFGIGAMIAFTPNDGSEASAWRAIHRLYDAGVISFISGQQPWRVRFLPPTGALSMAQIDDALAIVEEALCS